MARGILQALAVACAAVTAQALSAPVTLKPNPVLYVYDHCPFCVRARVALGLKNVKYDVRFLANDDVDLPTSMVGKKIAPIFDDGVKEPFPESMDIVAYVDENEKFGSTGMFKPASDRTDLKAWQKTVQTPLRLLQRPRYMKTMLPEFAFKSSRDTFVKNHQLPPYEKADWRSDQLTMDQRWGMYNDALGDSDKLIAEVNEKLKDLEPLIHCPECCTEGGVSYDDIDLWARLRSLTLVKGIEFPPTVRAYLDHFAEAGDCPTYDAIAL